MKPKIRYGKLLFYIISLLMLMFLITPVVAQEYESAEGLLIEVFDEQIVEEKIIDLEFITISEETDSGKILLEELREPLILTEEYDPLLVTTFVDSIEVLDEENEDDQIGEKELPEHEVPLINPKIPLPLIAPSPMITAAFITSVQNPRLISSYEPSTTFSINRSYTNSGNSYSTNTFGWSGSPFNSLTFDLFNTPFNNSNSSFSNPNLLRNSYSFSNSNPFVSGYPFNSSNLFNWLSGGPYNNSNRNSNTFSWYNNPFINPYNIFNIKPKNYSSSQKANPAAVYCKENGGTSEIRTNEDGSQYGVCIFSDGSECDEWAYYRGECQPSGDQSGIIGMPNPASVYCEENGGTSEIRTNDDGSQYGVCIFSDGSECDEWAYYKGECQSSGDQSGISGKPLIEGCIGACGAPFLASYEVLKNGAYRFTTMDSSLCPNTGAEVIIYRNKELEFKEDMTYGISHVIPAKKGDIITIEANLFEIDNGIQCPWLGELYFKLEKLGK